MKGRVKLPKAVVPTDLYGQCCDLPRIVAICDRYGVPVICDSAEAIGGRFLSNRNGSRPQAQRKNWIHAGKSARAAVYSFNGNKILTTSGGGMAGIRRWGIDCPCQEIVHSRRGRIFPIMNIWSWGIIIA